MKLTNSLAIAISFGALLFRGFPPDVVVLVSALAVVAAVSVILTPKYQAAAIGRTVRVRNQSRHK